MTIDKFVKCDHCETEALYFNGDSALCELCHEQANLHDLTDEFEPSPTKPEPPKGTIRRDCPRCGKLQYGDQMISNDPDTKVYWHADGSPDYCKAPEPSQVGPDKKCSDCPLPGLEETYSSLVAERDEKQAFIISQAAQITRNEAIIKTIEAERDALKFDSSKPAGERTYCRGCTLPKENTQLRERVGELITACKAYLKLQKKQDDGQEDVYSSEWEEVIESVRAAIDKAKGE